jgi:ferredoxin
MRVWIDQDLCTGDGLCAEIAPDVFTMMDDGLAYVKEGDKIFASSVGNPEGAAGLASFADDRLDDVIESAEECPSVNLTTRMTQGSQSQLLTLVLTMRKQHPLLPRRGQHGGTTSLAIWQNYPQHLRLILEIN